MKCKTHPKYQAKRKPMHTVKYPNGCPQCWKVWHSEITYAPAAKTFFIVCSGDDLDNYS